MLSSLEGPGFHLDRRSTSTASPLFPLPDLPIGAIRLIRDRCHGWESLPLVLPPRELGLDLRECDRAPKRAVPDQPEVLDAAARGRPDEVEPLLWAIGGLPSGRSRIWPWPYPLARAGAKVSGRIPPTSSKPHFLPSLQSAPDFTLARPPNNRSLLNLGPWIWAGLRFFAIFFAKKAKIPRHVMDAREFHF